MGKGELPRVKEFFFDDDTFNIQKVHDRAVQLKPLNLAWRLHCQVRRCGHIEER
jgi:hypothetical protein